MVKRKRIRRTMNSIPSVAQGPYRKVVLVLFFGSVFIVLCPLFHKVVLVFLYSLVLILSYAYQKAHITFEDVSKWWSSWESLPNTILLLLLYYISCTEEFFWFLGIGNRLDTGRGHLSSYLLLSLTNPKQYFLLSLPPSHRRRNWLCCVKKNWEK